MFDASMPQYYYSLPCSLSHLLSCVIAEVARRLLFVRSHLPVISRARLILDDKVSLDVLCLLDSTRQDIQCHTTQ